MESRREIVIVIGKKHLIGMLGLTALLGFASVLCWAGIVVSIALVGQAVCTPEPTALAVIVQTKSAATPTGPALTPGPPLSVATLPPLPTPTPTIAAGDLCTPVYIVQAGDTLQSIAMRCKTTAEGIARANNLPANAPLKIGQQLVMPQNGRAAPPLFSLTASPTPFPLTGLQLPTLTPAPFAESACEINAWMSDYEPDQHAQVTVFAELKCDGQPAVGAPMRTRWNYKDQVVSCDQGVTDSEGVASCMLDIGPAEAGYYVRIEISIPWQGRTYTFITGFTPH